MFKSTFCLTYIFTFQSLYGTVIVTNVSKNTYIRKTCVLKLNPIPSHVPVVSYQMFPCLTITYFCMYKLYQYLSDKYVLCHVYLKW